MSKKSIEAAWSDFYKSCQTDSYEDMVAQGWKTIAEASKEFGISRSTIDTRMRDGYLDSVKKRVVVGGIARMVNFVRPKALA